MKLRIRLYKAHDPDLYSMYGDRKLDFSHEVKSCLWAFARGTGYVINNDAELSMPPWLVERRYIEVTIMLDTKDDAELITLIGDRVAYGYRNAFVKCVVRQYMRFPVGRFFLRGNAPMPEPEGKVANTVGGFHGKPILVDAIMDDSDDGGTGDSPPEKDPPRGRAKPHGGTKKDRATGNAGAGPAHPRAGTTGMPAGTAGMRREPPATMEAPMDTQVDTPVDDMADVPMDDITGQDVIDSFFNMLG